MDTEVSGGGNPLTAEFTGTQKAAILLIALGPEKSSAIFKHLKYLNEKMVDLGKPVVVRQGDKTLFEGVLEPSEDLRRSTLFTRNDLSYSFPCCIEVKL